MHLLPVVNAYAEIVKFLYHKGGMMIKLFSWALDKEKERRVSILQKVHLFKGLRRNLLMKLLVDLVEKEYEPGELIFSEGEIGKALYIILDGSVTIAKKGKGDCAVLAELQAGSYFGELALIDQLPRFATASAQKRTTMLIMYKSYFDDLIKGSPVISSRVLLNLVELLAAYVRKNHDERT
ncbi:MAG: cyclic nucleotide-binding domain-containing protein [Nitrospirae bacterium]|nr:cyclic nucleotide-binding domain-containing protein [Nitrospirota bacterium]